MDDLREAQEVLDFWFGAPGSPEYGQPRAQWFRKDASFDARIGERFGGLHARLARGEGREWDAAPASLLARIVVLDQFSRNIHRGSPEAFASDPLALAAAGTMLARGWDAGLEPAMRLFVYLPFEHSEDARDQERSVALIGSLAADPRFADLPQWALRHQEVILRFGRFPHRNAILGRASTPEEMAFLREPGSSF